MKTTGTLFFILFIVKLGAAQNEIPSVKWQKTFNGINESDNVKITCIQKTKDGKYMCVGSFLYSITTNEAKNTSSILMMATS